VYWHDVQPQPGTPDFTRTDAMVGAAARARLHVLAVVLWAPDWAAQRPVAFNSPPQDPATYGRFLQALIHRYGPKGSFWPAHPSIPRRPIRAWQVWNEPDHTVYWRTQPFVPGYAKLLRTAHHAIKQADRHATVVLAGFATGERNWPVFRRLYRAGARRNFDVVGIHPYTREVSNVVRLVANARRALRKLHDGRRPLWATEVTWPASKGRMADPFAFAVDPATQASNIRAVLPRLAAQRRSLGLAHVFWESWLTGYRSDSNVFDYSGLRSPGEDRPGLRAFRAAARELERR
jgi:hypothetical protein